MFAFIVGKNNGRNVDKRGKITYGEVFNTDTIAYGMW